MNCFKHLIIGTAAVIGFASSANAAYVPATWTDEIANGYLISGGNSYTYTHDVGDYASGGFRPLLDRITDFSLAIDLFDDQNRDESETAKIYITSPLFGADATIESFEFGNNAFNGWSIAGWWQLNLLGSLTVTVKSVCNWSTCGDFILGTSTLTANGERYVPASVPEPGTIALLGFGLLGIGLGRRKAAK